MPKNFALGKEILWSRRQLLTLGLGGGGVTAAAALWHMVNVQNKSIIRVPPPEMEAPNNIVNPMKVLRDFDYGTLKRENGRTIREFRITAGNATIQLNSAHKTIDTSLAELTKVWPAAIPPATAVKTPEDVTKLVKTIEQNSQIVIEKSSTQAKR